MAEGGSAPGNNPLLSGMFGAFQQAAQGHQTTAEVWSALRQAAGTWEFQALGGGELPPLSDLEARGAQILRDQGVGIQQVNQYRAIAGQWRSSRDSLHANELTDQLTAQDVFVPPWASTSEGAVPTKYRVRVNWEVTPTTGDVFTTWGAYELSSPLTSLADVLAQAGQLVGKKPTSDMPPGSQVTDISDFEIEQI